MANISYKCPTCGAEIFWDASAGKFLCKYCGDEFTMEDMEASGQAQAGAVDNQHVELHEEIVNNEYTSSTDGTVGSNLVKYKCSYCGSEIITDRATAATVCVYCGNAVVMGEQLINDFAPDYVIPFKVEKARVMQAFKEFSKKPLTPKAFDPEKVVEKMQGVYIPFWLYSGECEGYMDAECVNEKTTRQGDYRVVEKKIYNVLREGKVRFKNVPVDGSSKTDDAAMDSIEPYDYKDLVPFKPAYLSGFLAERYDEDAEKCFERAKLRIENTTLDKLKESAPYDRITVRTYNKNIKKEKPKYALMPTWLLYTVYNGEKYFFAMNGQTGKFIGNLPIDKGKLTVCSILGAIVGGFLGYILMR
ncbi:MAG: hypothetical protein K6B74_12820 [Ruminococcus sp.]|nr:hypothetical protein [Ruminococcus sp.]